MTAAKVKSAKSTKVFTSTESQVRSYSRQWPVVFRSSQGSYLVSEKGEKYLDLFAGAGALNYGHNDPDMVRAMVEYLSEGGILHSLDMYTSAKADFLRALSEIILAPRGLDYKVQFPGPTGTNAVEAALKLARKVTGRSTIAHFTRSFHGMTLGSLAVSGNGTKRKGAGVDLTHTLTLPFEGTGVVDGLDVLEQYLADPSSGVETPAAVIVETVQGEGGINVASIEWLQKLSRICRDHHILLIVDDVQMGCGRTGTFFSFEPANIVPDIVVLSKSIGGCGQPLAVTLMRPDLDIWKPAEHNGTFRGNNLAFVAATVALRKFWSSEDLSTHVHDLGAHLADRLAKIARRDPTVISSRGRGLAQALSFSIPGMAESVMKDCFAHRVIVETTGSYDEAVKFLPPLTITQAELDAGIDQLEASINRLYPNAEPLSRKRREA